VPAIQQFGEIARIVGIVFLGAAVLIAWARWRS